MASLISYKVHQQFSIPIPFVLRFLCQNLLVVLEGTAVKLDGNTSYSPALRDHHHLRPVPNLTKLGLAAADVHTSERYGGPKILVLDHIWQSMRRQSVPKPKLYLPSIIEMLLLTLGDFRNISTISIFLLAVAPYNFYNSDIKMV